MTVGALCAHLVRAAGSVLAYLDRTDPDARPAGELLTPVTYFHAAIDSPIHERIKEVSADEAAVGAAEVARHCEEVAAAMRTRLAEEPTDRLVAALGGRMLSLDDFCRTRLIEVLFHLDDVAASVGVPCPDTSVEGRTIVIDTVVGIARMQARRLGGAPRAGPGGTPGTWTCSRSSDRGAPGGVRSRRGWTGLVSDDG